LGKTELKSGTKSIKFPSRKEHVVTLRRNTGNLPEDEPVLQKGVCRGLDQHSPVEHATRHKGKLGKFFEKLNKIKIS
jgi:hypothetical protein